MPPSVLLPGPSGYCTDTLPAVGSGDRRSSMSVLTEPMMVAFVGKAIGFILLLFILAFVGIIALVKKVL
jgi:hypothetical protein